MHLVRVQAVHLDALAAVESGEVGDEPLDREHAAVGEVLGDVREAPQLVVLGEQPEQRVEGDEDEREPALDPDVGEVAHRHGDAGAAGLLAQLSHHRLRGIDAVDIQTAGCQGQGEPAGADRELEHGAVAGERGDALDRGLGVQPRVEAVVDVGDPVAVGLGAVLVHARKLPCPERVDVALEALGERPVGVLGRDSWSSGVAASSSNVSM